MSQETQEWLSNNVLVGFTDKRGNAWHYRKGDTNHYADAIPVGDVEKRLFDWNAVEVPEQWTYDGTLYTGNDKVIIRSDTGAKMGTFKSGYVPHQYREWLLNTVSSILGDTLSIGSAGLLKAGAVAWVSVEVPENRTVEGTDVVYRPNLLAATSFDGSLATTFKRVVTNVVCDNTMAAGLAENGQVFKTKHSKYSGMKLNNAREALGVITETADAFDAEIQKLIAQEIPDKGFEDIMDKLAPLAGVDAGKRAQTMSETKRDALWNLWENDLRVAPWRGTGYGVWQTYNTYGQHASIVRKTNRAERNMLNVLTGKTEESDTEVLQLLHTL